MTQDNGGGPRKDSAVAPRARAYEDAMSQIRGLITDAELGPGDALPSERRLSELFGVSRHSLREAIRVLQEQGVLAPRRGSGNYIRPSTREELLEALSQLDSSDARRLFEVFQLRALMEPQIAALAAEMILPEQLAQMEDLVRQQMATTEPRDLKLIDRRFHALLAQATGNRTLVELMARIGETLELSRAESQVTEERRVASISGHCRLLAALQARSPERAAATMRDHIKDIKSAIDNA